MENPLTEEQIKKLNTISKLKPEEQQNAFQDFLKELNPEQIEFLKQKYSGGGDCPFCLIVEGKLQSHKVYEDEQILAVLDIHPANKGHVIVFPKKHYSVLAQMSGSEIAHIFTVASKLSAIVFDKVGAEGTNILLSAGVVAGQAVPHVLVHIIPRFRDDGLDFSWKPKEFSEEELERIRKELVEVSSSIVAYNEPIVDEVTEPIEEDYEEEERIP